MNDVVAITEQLIGVPPDVECDVFNVSFGRPTNLSELAEMVKTVGDAPVSETHTDPKVRDIRHSPGSNAHLQVKFGPLTLLSIDNGVRATVEAEARV